MSSEVAEQIREVASTLLAVANRLDGIDTSLDAARSGTVYVPQRYELEQGANDWVHAKCKLCNKRWLYRAEELPAVFAQHDQEHDGDVRYIPPGEEPEMIPVQVMTGRSFGVYAHRDPVAPLQIDDCGWPHGTCRGHRVGLGGMPLLTVPDDQAVHVPHMHLGFKGACSEIACHATGGRPCSYCGGAPCRITPVERSA